MSKLSASEAFAIGGALGDCCHKAVAATSHSRRQTCTHAAATRMWRKDIVVPIGKRHTSGWQVFFIWTSLRADFIIKIIFYKAVTFLHVDTNS